MPLKNYQYNAVMRIYDSRQAASRALLEKRQQEIEQTLPAYSALHRQIIENSMNCARASLFTRDTADADVLRRQNEELSKKKEALLLSAGYPADYLSPVYVCPDCADTGMIGEERCHCFKQAVVDLLYAQSNIANIIKEDRRVSINGAAAINTAVFRLQRYDQMLTINEVGKFFSGYGGEEMAEDSVTDTVEITFENWTKN